ncbi:hypothetical protein [Bradyrhizobium sp. B117]|uniref:hypothetical protein n=1 Tax=Bradyrhizobium sp. B117 TaxID=3140246 RepID=UPI003183BB8A
METLAATSVIIGCAVAAAGAVCLILAHDHVRIGLAIDCLGRRRASEMALLGDWRDDLVFAAMSRETTKYRV